MSSWGSNMDGWYVKNALAKHGINAVYFDVIDSTSREAYRRAIESNMPAYTLVFAASQSDGYGKRGRKFLSPAGGVYFSLLLPITQENHHVFETTNKAAIVMKEAVSTLFSRSAEISGNDLFLRGKKVCGIITEAYEGFAVLGVGVNLFGGEYPGLPNAGAVLTDAEEVMDNAREQLIVTAVKLLLKEFETV